MNMKSKSQRGFTILELLTTIAVIAILAAILVPVTGVVRESARRSHCANNLRQIGMSFQLYASGHNNRLPANIEEMGGVWAWDVTVNVIDDLINAGGGERDMFFCRSGAMEDRMELWDFAVSRAGGVETGFRVIAYVLLLENAPGLLPQYANTHMTDPVRVPVEGGRTEQYEFVSASQRELAVDAVISMNGESFDRVQGDSQHPDRTNHLDGPNPLGGNILFLDGHVTWRAFADMDDEKIEGEPKFWW